MLRDSSARPGTTRWRASCAGIPVKQRRQAVFADPNENLTTVLSPLRDRLLNPPQAKDALGYLTFVASVITEAFIVLGKTPPTVVGGLAVETYTAGGYTTLDVDMIAADDALVTRVMGALGFHRKRGHRHYEHPNLDALVEFPPGPLEGSDDRIARIVLDSGGELRVIGIEDIILDRVSAYVHWDKRRENSADAAQAVLLIVAQRDKIDHEYLRRAAEERGLSEGLADTLAKASELEKER